MTVQMKNQKKKISVIMGVYNCESYEEIKRAVDSIIKQTYTNWEFIICDDGSTNQTSQWLKQIVALDQRIKIIGYKENHGLAYALNECLKVSTGELIARQDTSDYSYPERFAIELDELKKNPQIDFVSCAMDLFDQVVGIWGQSHPEEYPSKKSFLFNSPFSHTGLLCPIYIFQEVDGYQNWNRCEDYDLFMRMYAAGYKGKNIQQCLYAYDYPKEFTKNKRPLPVRWIETKVRLRGFKKLGILFPLGVIYTIKPLLMCLLPLSVKNTIKQWQMQKSQDE